VLVTWGRLLNLIEEILSQRERILEIPLLITMKLPR
jgi:hypothetical protein